jgi:hypothetical protein
MSAVQSVPSVAAVEPDADPVTVAAGGSEPAVETAPQLRLRSGVADSSPAMRRTHRNWFLAMAVVIVLAILFVARVAVSDSGAEPAGGNAAEWFVPSAPGPAEVTPDGPTEAAGGTPDYPQGGGNPQRTGGRPAATGTAVVVPSGGGGDPLPQPTVPATPPQNATAYTFIQAESFDEQNGVKIENAPAGSGRHVGFITKGDWIRYDDIGFTDVPATGLQISAANWAKNDGTGVVEVRLDDRANLPIGVMTIPNNHSWFDFVTYSMTIRPTTGVHVVYLTFTSNQREEFGNIDWLRFRH